MKNVNNTQQTGPVNPGIRPPSENELAVAVRSTASAAFENGSARELKYKGVKQNKKDTALVKAFEKLPKNELINIPVAGADVARTAGLVNGRIVVKETGQVPGLALGYYDAGAQPVF